jgi:hypothetical protein
MAGTMREGKSPGSWEPRVELARDPATGKRRWRSRTVCGSKKQASRELAQLVVEVGGLDVAEMGGGSVRDLGERWLKHLEARGRERSTTTSTPCSASTSESTFREMAMAASSRVVCHTSSSPIQ